MKVLFTDHDMLDVTLEQRIFEEAGIELAIAQCRTEDDVIRAGRGCSALLIQYAPITGHVLEALPQVRLCSRIGAGSVVHSHTVMHGIRAGAKCEIGPFARLRPGAALADRVKAGNFVEIKNSAIAPGSKVNHLTYVGDATIGEGSNIGASSVFVNFDGVNKHHTTIGSHVRTGSDNTFVAPVTVGDGAYTGAGSVIRNDVPPGALAVSAGSQRTIEGWVLRSRAGTPAAEAAAAALAETEHGLSPQARAERERARNHELPAPAGPGANDASTKDKDA